MQCSGEYVGKRVVVGMTFYDRDGALLGQRQFCGEIISVSRTDGVVLKDGDSGEELRLPPDLRALQPAPAGEYTEQGSGKVVRDPDYIALWSFHKRPGDGEEGEERWAAKPLPLEFDELPPGQGAGR